MTHPASSAASRQLRVGVVGTGVMGTDHARLLARSVSGAVLTRVTDLDAARAGALAAELGARTSQDGALLIADAEVDAVVVASADATHAELVLAAAAAGKPVLCEKPLAPSLAQAHAVVSALERDGTAHLVSLGFMQRFDPGYVDLRGALRDGAVGTPLVVHGTSRGVSSGPGATSASSITGSFVHEADTVPWLLGSPVAAVSWQAPRRTSEAGEQLQDPQLLLLRTADGVLTTVEVFLNARYGYDVRCEVVGERGALALTEPVARTTRTGDLGMTTAYAADWRPRFAEAYRRELQAWVDDVRGLPASSGTGASELATARDGLVAAAVCDAAVRSMEAASLTADGAGPWTTVEVPE